MPNNINSANTAGADSVYAVHLYNQGASRFIEAPVRLPKYSINKELQEKDEFRRTALQNYKSEKKEKKRGSLLKKGIAIAAAIGILGFLDYKKII